MARDEFMVADDPLVEPPAKPPTAKHLIVEKYEQEDREPPPDWLVEDD